jgi:hypothetical protein
MVMGIVIKSYFLAVGFSVGALTKQQSSLHELMGATDANNVSLRDASCFIFCSGDSLQFTPKAVVGFTSSLRELSDCLLPGWRRRH